MPEIIVTGSSHPDYNYIAMTTINGRQFASRGDTAEEIGEWIDRMVAAGSLHGIEFTLNDMGRLFG